MKRELRASFDDDVNKELECAMEEEIRENILGSECEEMPTDVEKTITVQSGTEVIDIDDESDSEECKSSNNQQQSVYIISDNNIPNENNMVGYNKQGNAVLTREGVKFPLNGGAYVIATGNDVVPQTVRKSVMKTPLPPRKGSIKNKSRNSIRSPDCEIIEDNAKNVSENKFSKHLIVHASLNKDPGITEESLIELALHMPDGRVLHFNTTRKDSSSPPQGKITEKNQVVGLQNQQNTTPTFQKDRFISNNMVKNVLPKQLNNSPTKIVKILPTPSLLNTTGISPTSGLKQIVVNNSETGISNPTLLMQTVPYIQPVTSGTVTTPSGGVSLVSSSQLLTSKAINTNVNVISPNKNVQQPVRLLLPKSTVGPGPFIVTTGAQNQNSTDKNASNTAGQIVNSPVNNIVLQTTGNSPSILGCLINPQNQNVSTTNMGMSTANLQAGNSQLIYLPLLQQPSCLLLPNTTTKPSTTKKQSTKPVQYVQVENNSPNLNNQLIAESLKSLTGLGKRQSDQSVAVTKRVCFENNSGTQNVSNKSARKKVKAGLPKISPKNGFSNSFFTVSSGTTNSTNLIHNQKSGSGATTLQVIPLHTLQQPAANIKSVNSRVARVAKDDSVKTSNESGYDSDVEIVTVTPSITK